MPTQVIQPMGRSFTGFMSYKDSRSVSDIGYYPDADAEPWFLEMDWIAQKKRGKLCLGHGAASVNQIVLDPWETDNRSWNWFDSGFAGTLKRDYPKPAEDVPDVCRYCQSHLVQTNHELHAKKNLKRNAAVTLACPACGWWKVIKCRGKRVHSGSWEFGSLRTDFYSFEGVLAEFPLNSDQIAIRKLGLEIQKRKIDLRDISPTHLEKLVGFVFADLYGCEVHHIGGPGDGGIDLLIGIGRKPIAVQVKRRQSSQSVEGVSIVRNFLGAMVLSKLKRGIVVSTARDFSKPARIATAAGNGGN